jgi:hypothetical protein
MPTNLRTLGVRGKSLPTKKSKTVQGSNFNIGGLITLMSRRYKVPMLCNNIEEMRDIFGNQEITTYYGWDAAKGFWDNVAGVQAKLYLLSHVGYTGAAYDGVAATDTLLDGLGANTLQLDSAYEDELDYSTWGNRTGYTITNGSRFTTTIKTTGTKDDTFVICTSVSGMKVGDIIKVVSTGAGGATVYKKITNINESTGTISFSGAFDGTANAAATDAVTIPGFRLRLWRQSMTGIVSEVEEELGKIYCTMEDEVTDYYVEKVFANSKYVKTTDKDSVSAIGSSFPVNVTDVTYLASGANGTAPTTAAHYALDLTAFDNLPVRFMANCESTVTDVQKAIETYCRTRTDLPKVIYNVPESQSKAQLITLGNSYQRSDDVLGVIVSDWLKISDPFASSTIAPDREIPCVGHVMGCWIRTIAMLGIHYIPCTKDTPIYGANDIVRTTAYSDTDRTDLAQNGINVIDFLSGYGLIIRNLFTPSTATEFMFANGILMREYIKISAVDSLQTSENTPNSFERILEDKMAILNFLLSLWFKGSTGNVPPGETFGQGINDDGTPTKWSDHLIVQADAINNPQSQINLGYRNIDTWFTYPAPAGSIEIGVGILLRS